MFCAVRVANIAATRVTRNETGIDEIYFVLSGGSSANMKSGIKIKRYGTPDIWEAGPGKPPPHHITLWQGFVQNNEVATLTVTLREQDASGVQLIGRFKVSITANHPQPTFNWQADSTYTSIVGAPNGALATIHARESQADYLLTVIVDQGRTITNVHSNKCLDVAGGIPDNNANVQQFGCHGGPDQKWFPRLIQLNPPSAGSPPFPPFVFGELRSYFWAFAFHVDHSGSCLDVADAEGSQNVQQFAPHFGPNQKWFILPAQQAGEFFIISAWNGWALDVEGESMADGGNVQVFPFHGNANQRWRINPPPLIDSTAIGGEIWNLIRS